MVFGHGVWESGCRISDLWPLRGFAIWIITASPIKPVKVSLFGIEASGLLRNSTATTGRSNLGKRAETSFGLQADPVTLKQICCCSLCMAPNTAAPVPRSDQQTLRASTAAQLVSSGGSSRSCECIGGASFNSLSATPNTSHLVLYKFRPDESSNLRQADSHGLPKAVCRNCS